MKAQKGKAVATPIQKPAPKASKTKEALTTQEDTHDSVMSSIEDLKLHIEPQGRLDRQIE